MSDYSTILYNAQFYHLLDFKGNFTFWSLVSDLWGDPWHSVGTLFSTSPSLTISWPLLVGTCVAPTIIAVIRLEEKLKMQALPMNHWQASVENWVHFR